MRIALPSSHVLNPDEDVRLVALCVRGDAAAWEALVRRHERLVYAIARSYRLSEADTGDVFQEVFAALVRGLPRMRDSRALCRWLSSTTERIARATALRRRREEALAAPTDPTALANMSADEPPVGAELERLEEQARVRLALSALPERCRSLIQALYYEEPPPQYAELARRLRLPVGSLGPTRARCFDRLRRILSTQDEQEGRITGDGRDTSEQREASRGRAHLHVSARRAR
jgi:RNA polymerase sigma factor (sigma-70 family)